MDKMRRKTISTLKDLLRICKDEYTFFQTASEKSSDPELKPILLKYAAEKEEYAAKLKKEIKRLGESPDLSVLPATAYTSETFENTDYSQKEILLQCIKKDDISIKRYSAAIKEDILWEVIPLIAKQYFGSLNSHDIMMAYIKPATKQHLQVVA